MALIYHLALANQWAEAQSAGSYTVSTLGMDLAEVGFIHCSRETQVDGVYEAFYSRMSEPVLVIKSKIPADLPPPTFSVSALITSEFSNCVRIGAGDLIFANGFN
jgi:hypothetical protein